MVFENRIHFLANVCHVCKSKKSSYPCLICGLIFYCSPEHRRENWPIHSRMCWALSKIFAAENRSHLLEGFAAKEVVGFKHQVAGKVMQLLGRSLEPWEIEMIYHPRVCDVCQEYDHEKLKTCENCEFVYTCDKNHFQKDHKKWCEILKIYSDVSIYENSNVPDVRKFLREELSVDSGANESMNEVLSGKFAKDDVEKFFFSELLTYPLTVWHSLKTLKICNKETLSVLFLGAEVQAEVEPLEKWERFLLHNLNNKVNRLNLIFLGPELRMVSCEKLADLCESCRSMQKTLKFEFISGKFYHEYSNDDRNNPDLICALNSGMYRDFGFAAENSWEETILRLFSRGSPPVLITEYTCHELKLDLEKIGRLTGDVSFIVGCSTNPFASLKPGLNIIPENDAPVIFKNYQYVLVKKEA